MEKLKKVLKQNVNIIFVCLFELIVGILMLIDPDGFTSAVIIIGGIVLMGAGLYSSVRYFREEQTKAASGQLLMMGLVFIFAGAFCVFRSDWFISNIPLYTVVYGVIILMLAFCKVQIAVDSMRAKERRWYLYGVGAILSALASVAILTELFGKGRDESLLVFTGVSLIVLFVLDSASAYVNKMDARKQKKEKAESDSIAPPAEENEEE